VQINATAPAEAMMNKEAVFFVDGSKRSSIDHPTDILVRFMFNGPLCMFFFTDILLQISASPLCKRTVGGEIELKLKP
jgi:hypothetical protein